MKRIRLIFLLSLISITVFSQIPNQGFENWTTVGSYQNPDGWGTLNNLTAPSGIFTATKGTPGNVGASYLKLTSKTINSSVVNGIAVSGILDSITLQPKSGFAFSQRPQTLTGKWQHMIYGSSQGSVSVTLTKWNSSTMQRDIIASASQTLSGMAMSWATFTLTLNYISGSSPDSCIILLKASGSNPTNNDYLWVDNLTFNGSVTGINDNAESISNFKNYPVPAQNEWILEAENNYETGDVLIIYNAIGNIVYKQKISGRVTRVNTSDFENGIYLYSYQNKNQKNIIKGKILIQH